MANHDKSIDIYEFFMDNPKKSMDLPWKVNKHLLIFQL